jgi:hypothetical protein
MTTIEYAYRRFNTERFPLPSESQVAFLEQRINISFPDEFRRFVLEFNGGYFNEPVILPVVEGCPEDALSFICGISPSHEEALLGRDHYLSLFDDNDPPKILPIGGTPMGALIILDTAPGEGRGTIYFKQAFGDFYYLADGIEDFFDLLREPSSV